MKKELKTLLKITFGVCATLTGIAEALLYLLSNRKGNVDFIFGTVCAPDDTSAMLDRKREADLNWLESQPLEDYHITSDDNLRLHASLLRAKTPSNKYVLAIHGYRCYGHKEFDSISRFYYENGINVFMPDHRASGESEGTYITYGALETRDCTKWLSFMRKSFGEDIEVILHGVSMGSSITMMMCGSIIPSNVKFAVADCGYSTLEGQLTHNFSQFKMPPKFCYELYRTAAMFQAGFDPSCVSPVTAMEKCNIPMIFVHGRRDNFVPFEMIYVLYDACPVAKKKIIAVPDADHAQSFGLSDEYKEAVREYIAELM